MSNCRFRPSWTISPRRRAGRSRYTSMSLVPVSASNHSATPTGTMPSAGSTNGDNRAIRAVAGSMIIHFCENSVGMSTFARFSWLLLRSSTKLKSGLNVTGASSPALGAPYRSPTTYGTQSRNLSAGAFLGVLPSAARKATCDLSTQSSRTGAAGPSGAEQADRHNIATAAIRAFMAGDSTGPDNFRFGGLYFCDAVTNPDY